MIVRHDRVQWTRVLEEVERKLATGRYSTIIAPEGTRSRDGKLLPFKKGAFHIAMGSKAAVVPISISFGRKSRPQSDRRAQPRISR